MAAMASGERCCKGLMLLSDESSDALRLCFQGSESSLRVAMNVKQPQRIGIDFLRRFLAALYVQVRVGYGNQGSVALADVATADESVAAVC
jgi:hypothetical protein